MKTLLTKGVKYKAAIKLSFLESVASNEVIRQKLIAAGFANVVVLGSGSERTATGIWPKESIAADIPTQIKKIEIL